MSLAALFGSHELNHLLSTYGYAAVFLIVGAESVGIPLPGETMLTVAAIYAGTTHRLNILGVIAAAAAGAIIGDNIGYLIGRSGGYRLLRRYGRYIRVDESRLKIVDTCSTAMAARLSSSGASFRSFAPTPPSWLGR
jgi:membrane protein DedA with SNARE-associated domain